MTMNLKPYGIEYLNRIFESREHPIICDKCFRTVGL